MLPAGPEPPEPVALHAPSSLSFPRSWCCRDLLALAGVLTKLRVPELFLESSPSTKRRRFSSWPAVTAMKQTLTRNSCRLCEEHRELPSSHPQFSPYFSGLRRNIFRSYNFRLWTRLFLKTFTDGLTNVLKLVMHH